MNNMNYLNKMNNMRNILDKLQNKADDISKELFKKRCILSRITSKDVYDNSVTDYFILEGRYKGLKDAIAMIESMITDSEFIVKNYA
jgi:hypothetical protein